MIDSCDFNDLINSVRMIKSASEYLGNDIAKSQFPLSFGAYESFNTFWELMRELSVWLRYFEKREAEVWLFRTPEMTEFSKLMYEYGRKTGCKLEENPYYKELEIASREIAAHINDYSYDYWWRFKKDYASFTFVIFTEFYSTVECIEVIVSYLSFFRRRVPEMRKEMNQMEVKIAA